MYGAVVIIGESFSLFLLVVRRGIGITISAIGRGGRIGPSKVTFALARFLRSLLVLLASKSVGLMLLINHVGF